MVATRSGKNTWKKVGAKWEDDTQTKSFSFKVRSVKKNSGKSKSGKSSTKSMKSSEKKPKVVTKACNQNCISKGGDHSKCCTKIESEQDCQNYEDAHFKGYVWNRRARDGKGSCEQTKARGGIKNLAGLHGPMLKKWKAMPKVAKERIEELKKLIASEPKVKAEPVAETIKVEPAAKASWRSRLEDNKKDTKSATSNASWRKVMSGNTSEAVKVEESNVPIKVESDVPDAPPLPYKGKNSKKKKSAPKKKSTTKKSTKKVSVSRKKKPTKKPSKKPTKKPTKKKAKAKVSLNKKSTLKKKSKKQSIKKKTM